MARRYDWRALLDGVEWKEAIGPALYPSLDAKAINRLEADQTGWIAACFLGE